MWLGPEPNAGSGLAASLKGRIMFYAEFKAMWRPWRGRMDEEVDEDLLVM